MILPIFKSGAKAVGKQALRSGIEVANDLIQGKEIKASAKQRAKEAVKILTEKTADKAKTMVGGNKRKRHSKKQVISKNYRKVCAPDIFTSPKMSLIHTDSQAAVKSEIDLFLTPPTQTAIKKGQWLEYHPIANIRNWNPIEFSISGSGEDFIDLSATQLHVKMKILKDNENLDETERVSPVNLLLHSLFSQVDACLNERLISFLSNLYPFRSCIQTLLN
ncbi:hypothetical protein AVEN_175146-1 [Araneus ventricosus]|uniref:Uncharacterized protein n=1 Tax=Araneus ventricosus TaxID=182803 RepID=A0A4Y2VCN7_ARAVE|nr:hypothetical protein AVEN_89486-1 [Araneus ventricosus]GBO21503.1 hypothetical protein AVEN_175146-1 [Araneus ventricosus]